MPTILIADDSIAVRKVAERLLTEAGLAVTLAANGEEALAYLKKDRPDLIVSDVIMPDKSGYEICTFVRGNSALAVTPVLLISGIVNDEVTKQAEACRADGILKKPFQGTLLKDTVLELLAKRQAQAPAPARPAGTPVTDKGPRIADEGQGVDRQTAIKLKEVEEQLHRERTRAEQLAARVADLEGEIGRGKGNDALLAAERRRANDLEAKVATLERQASTVPQLEAALKTERAAAAELVQQLTVLQQKARAAEAAFAAEQAKVSELSDKVAATEKAAQCVGEFEASLAEERRKLAENERRLFEMGSASLKVKELETLLTTERELKELLARRVSEAERAAENATKRFEDMARKLGEIAGLASQLGNGKGQS